MAELEKTVVGQLILNNLSLAAIVAILVVLLLFKGLFKVAKKEIDPLKWIADKIRNAFTKDVRKDLQDLKNDVASVNKDTNDQIQELRQDLDGFEERTNSSIDEMKSGTSKNCETLKKRLDEMEAAHQKSNDMQTIQTIRTHILDFANSCYNKRKHTKREFDNIIDENDLYEELVEKHDVRNSVYKEEFDFILKVYHKCKEEGSFLKEGD